MIQFLRLPLQPVERHSNRLLNRDIRQSTELRCVVFRWTIAGLSQRRCLHDSGDKSYTVSDLHGVGLARHILVVVKLQGDGAVRLQIVPCFRCSKSRQQQHHCEKARFHGGAFYTAPDSPTLEKRPKRGTDGTYSLVSSQVRKHCRRGLEMSANTKLIVPAIIARPLTSPVSVDLAAPLQTAAT